MRQYVFMYNAYVRYYDVYHDRKASLDAAAGRFKVTTRTVENAIRACKQLLLLKQELNAAAGFL